MRSAAFALSCLLFASLAVAQEPDEETQAPEAVPEQEPAPIAVLPIKVIDLTPAPEPKPKKDIWEWAPHLTAYYGKTTHGHFESPYWYRVQDRRFDVKEARTFGGDLTAGRWSIFGSITRVDDQPALRGSTAGIQLSPQPVGPIRGGLGFRYQSGSDAHVLFSSGGTNIAASSDRRLIAAVVDLGVGGYDRSHFRLQGLYGNARRTNTLDLFVNDRVFGSPLARHDFSHSDFFGAGATAAIRVYALSLDGAVTCYRPSRVSVALPADECVITGGGSVLLPLWLNFGSLRRGGSGAGIFIRYTRVNTARPRDNQSLQFLNESTTFGLTLRLP